MNSNTVFGPAPQPYDEVGGCTCGRRETTRVISHNPRCQWVLLRQMWHVKAEEAYKRIRERLGTVKVKIEYKDAPAHETDNFPMGGV